MNILTNQFIEQIFQRKSVCQNLSAKICLPKSVWQNMFAKICLPKYCSKICMWKSVCQNTSAEICLLIVVKKYQNSVHKNLSAKILQQKSVLEYVKICLPKYVCGNVSSKICLEICLPKYFSKNRLKSSCKNIFPENYFACLQFFLFKNNSLR